MKIRGKDKIISDLKSYTDTTKYVSICIENNLVISIENISEDFDVHIKNEPYVVLTPGTKISFGTLKRRLTRDELKLVYRSRIDYDDDDYGE